MKADVMIGTSGPAEPILLILTGETPLEKQALSRMVRAGMKVGIKVVNSQWTNQTELDQGAERAFVMFGEAPKL